MKKLLQVSVLMLCAATAFALKCYVCSGTEDTCSKSTLEGGKDKYLVTCPSGQDKCVRTWVQSQSKTQVTNGCSNQKVCDLAQTACDNLNNNLDDVDCAVGCCGSDACNAGTSEKGPGLKCFVCSGNEDDCKKSTVEGDKDKYLKTCNLGEDKCMRGWVNKDGEITVISSCASQHDCNLVKATCDEEDIDSADCTVSCCDTDACNAGSPLFLSALLLIVSSVLGLALLM